MILLSLLCCVLGVSALQPSCAALQQETQEAIIETKGKKNAFISYYNAYYSFADIGRMFAYSTSNMDNIENFGGTGNTGHYVLNNVGTYTFNSSFVVSNSFYVCDDDNNYRLTLVSSYSLVGIEFHTITVDYEYMWVFKTLVGGNTHLDFYVSMYKCDDYLNNQYRSSYSYDTYVLSNGSFSTVNQTYLGLYYLYFNLNTWGQYFTYPDEDLIFNQGYQSGYDYGFIVGQDKGYAEGLADSYDTGFQAGYSAGYDDGVNVDDTASTIFTGILEVGLLPVNVFLGMFNYEVFGVNIAGIVSSLMTVAIVVIIFRFLFGGKKDD